MTVETPRREDAKEDTAPESIENNFLVRSATGGLLDNWTPDQLAQLAEILDAWKRQGKMIGGVIHPGLKDDVTLAARAHGSRAAKNGCSLASPRLGVSRIRIRPVFAWYDLWVGAYWDRRRRRLWIMLPMIGIVVEFTE